VTLAVPVDRAESDSADGLLPQAELDNGVKTQRDLAIINHRCVLSGWWDNAMSAVFRKEVFIKRGIGPEQFRRHRIELLPLNEAAEKQVAQCGEHFGHTSPRQACEVHSDVLFVSW